MTSFLDPISSVLERISQIQNQFGPQPQTASAAVTTPASATSGTSLSTSGSNFATALAQYQPSADTTAVTGNQVVASAEKYLGVPYVWGGTTSAGLDCSGLVQKAYGDLGISLPRVSQDQATVGTAVPSLAQAQPGDLLGFGTPAHHIAIYLGNNQMIAAPQTGENVQIQSVYTTPDSIRRIVGDSATSTPAISTSTLSTAALSNAALSTSALSTSALSASSLSTSALSTSSLSTSSLSTSSLSASGLSTSAVPSTGITAAVQQYSPLFSQAEATYNLPSGLLAAVAQTESGGNASAVSASGAQGLMQFMPSSAAAMNINPWDPAQSIQGAAKLLSSYITKYQSVPLALAAYNAGPNAVNQYGGVPPYPETQNYVAKITGLMNGTST